MMGNQPLIFPDKRTKKKKKKKGQGQSPPRKKITHCISEHSTLSKFEVGVDVNGLW
jgi:hypothetical protein